QPRTTHAQPPKVDCSPSPKARRARPRGTRNRRLLPLIWWSVAGWTARSDVDTWGRRKSRMVNLLILALAGFIAQLIDGALGMGYGVTSTTMLLTMGLAPASVSASVHAGEVVTTLISGIAHWRFGNVDREMMWRLGVPGAIGAFCGALFLSSLPVHLARPGVSAFLLILGITVLVRF